MPVSLLSLLPPLGLVAPPLLAAAAAVAMTQPGRRPHWVRWLPEGAAVTALALSAGGAVQLLTGDVGGAAAAAAWFAFSPDAVGVTMALLVSFIGWVVLRFSVRAMDGEAREGRFHALMLTVLASVLLLVQAGSLLVMALAFIAAGLALRALLLFYPERAGARRAAAKFSLVWHLGDAALLLAAVLLVLRAGETGFAAVAQTVGQGLGVTGHLAVALIVVAAALKTAAFPVHGWLTEVMEAPTPVSALLHAGVINAGGVLLLRSADLVQASPGAMAALVMLGGLTALFGAVVMLAQNAVKTALAWSTVAQMGFMLMQSGLGLWPLVLLHIVAHALYKAHAFLSSGGAVASVAASARPGPVAVPDLWAVLRAFALAIALYGVMAAIFAVLGGEKSAQALALGTMLVFGVAYLVAQGLAGAAPWALSLRTAAASAGATLAYFGFQRLAAVLWGPALPPTPAAGPLEWALIVLAVLSFGLVALAQTLFPLWAHHPAAAGLRVHLANGLYLTTLTDWMTGGLRIQNIKQIKG